MSYRLNVRITDSQNKFMKTINISQSEFVRRALDYYILHLNNPHTLMILNELESWIEIKKKGVELNTDVQTEEYKCTPNNTQFDVTTTQTKSDETIKIPKKNKIPTKNKLKVIFHNELRTLHNLIVNPEGDHTVPDYTIKLLSKRYDVSKSVINAWIADNYEWLKEGDFDDV